MEEWKPVREMPDDYEVSSEGRVRRVSPTRGSRPGRERKQTLARNGYVLFVLKKDGAVFGRLGHRLVADAFLGPIPEGMQVNHKNGVKHDNRVENLEIVTNGENRAHSYRVLGVKPNRGAIGAKNPNVKLDWTKVDAIRAAYSEGSSYSVLARRFGVVKQTVAAIVKNRTWKEEDRPPRPV